MVAIGKKAPAFSLLNQDGEKIALKDLAGKIVVLYFYPKDMTPGCTTEACDFRDSIATFKKLKAVVLGVSKDSVEKHAAFAEKYDLPFSLLSDPDGKICEKYGVWQEKTLYGKKSMGIVRTTFVIDKNGDIAMIYPKVKVAGHIDAVNDFIASMKSKK